VIGPIGRADLAFSWFRSGQLILISKKYRLSGGGKPLPYNENVNVEMMFIPSHSWHL